MRKLFTAAFAAIVGVTGVTAAPMSVVAAPVVPLIQQGETANTVQVQYDGRWGERRILRRNWNGNRNWDGGRNWRRNQLSRGGFERRGGDRYYNGYRGSREYRRGYRRNGDFWFPAGAFIAGAIIGGALSNPGPTYYEPRRVYQQPRRVYRDTGGSAHVRWCYNRYRSYDAYSNTFQPYNGPRQQCWSPYS